MRAKIRRWVQGTGTAGTKYQLLQCKAFDSSGGNLAPEKGHLAALEGILEPFGMSAFRSGKFNHRNPISCTVRIRIMHILVYYIRSGRIWVADCINVPKM